jgi:hypothetical protein
MIKQYLDCTPLNNLNFSAVKYLIFCISGLPKRLAGLFSSDNQIPTSSTMSFSPDAICLAISHQPSSSKSAVASSGSGILLKMLRK